MTELTKKCPCCAEAIKFEAVKCRYCHADLPAPDASLLHSDRDKAAKANRSVLIVLLSVATAGVLGSLFHDTVADLFRPTPVEITLADLEGQFSEDTPAALAHWRNRPMLLSAVVASGQGDSVALESIFPFAVHARLNTRLEGADGQKIVLHCRDIKEGGLIGGKPEPLNCSIVALGD